MAGFDATALLYALDPKAPVPLDPATNEPVQDAKARIGLLLKKHTALQERIAIPTPALSSSAKCSYTRVRRPRDISMPFPSRPVSVSLRSESGPRSNPPRSLTQSSQPGTSGPGAKRPAPKSSSTGRSSPSLRWKAGPRSIPMTKG